MKSIGIYNKIVTDHSKLPSIFKKMEVNIVFIEVKTKRMASMNHRYAEKHTQSNPGFLDQSHCPSTVRPTVPQLAQAIADNSLEVC